jgi:tagatose-1,6-bisphosphate aldolase non-catalytic subunit AgaZ/GatZ
MLAADTEVTLLAVCPNSEAVTLAALRAAQKADAPLMFAATLNQVDLDGGYTGWSPVTFCEFLQVHRALLGVSIPVIVGLDHGGPWTRDLHVSQAWTLDETLDAVRRSVIACLEAGYGLLHIDATVDPTSDGEVALETIISRTVGLIEYAEDYRRSEQLPPVAYEVGTEEVHGGMADRERFVRFVEMLETSLDERGLSHAWPVFFVGRVGTDLHTSTFNTSEARALADLIRPRGSVVKGHYTDYVDNPKAYPAARVGGANVGPEFADVEVTALGQLCSVEESRGLDSRFAHALREAVVRSNRWRKWLTAEERGCSFANLPDARQDWLARTGSRYVWRETTVMAARRRLYENVAAELDPAEFVVGAIQTRIDHYIRAFNLAGFAGQVQQWLTA